MGSIWAGGIGIDACQELDPIADRGPAVFGNPCSRRSDSVTVEKRSSWPDVDDHVGSGGAVGGRWGSSGSRGQPWDAVYPGRAVADSQPIHHRRHHHRESAETRVTRGRGRV